jgi:hypothetical protein
MKGHPEVAELYRLVAKNDRETETAANGPNHAHPRPR